MKAVFIAGAGGPEVLRVQDMPKPVPGDGEVLVAVKASALNRADLLQRQGKYPAPANSPQSIPGIEFAGVVSAVSEKTKLWQLGQRVFGIAGGGAHAEFIAVPERTLCEIPDSLSWVEAASIPEAFITAHDALWKQAGLRPSESVLIHAVGSGVGLAAVQLVRAISAIPFGTSRTQDKLRRAKEFGLEEGFVLGASAEELKRRAKEATAGHGFDVVLDLVGGAYASASILALAPHGRLLLVGTVAGGTAEFNLGQILGKRLRIMGTVMRARPLEEKISAAQAFAAEVVPLFARRVLQPVIDSEFEIGDIQAAHQRLESNETFGKVIIRVAN